MRFIKPVASSCADPHLNEIFNLLATRGAVTALVLLHFLLRPVFARRVFEQSTEETDRVKREIQTFGNDPSDLYLLSRPERHVEMISDHLQPFLWLQIPL